MRQATNVPDVNTIPMRAPINQFAHFREYPRAEAKDVVRFNFDTLYSFAWLDISKEPIILTVPDTNGRYYLLPMLDLWSDVFAVPGSRTTGGKAGNYAITAPKWQGTLPADVEQIRAPTPIVWLMGRTQTNGPSDYANVHKVQDSYKLTPLSQWGKTYVPPTHSATDPTVDNETPPLVQINHLDGIAVLKRFAKLLETNPPHANDYPILHRLRRLGLSPGNSFDTSKLDPSTIEAINTAAKEVKKELQELVSQGKIGEKTNGWNYTLNGMGTYGTDYRMRAVVAMAGLGANLPEDAIYPNAFVDADGNPTSGDYSYVLHFDKGKLPPANAFWSLTMYDMDGFQVPNPLNRFAIGDRDKLSFNSDGSLDIYIQNQSPGKEKESNWLPAPKGRFQIMLRMYSPKSEVFRDGLSLPPLTKLSHNNSPLSNNAKNGSAPISPAEAKELAIDAYIYAYPTVLMQVTRNVGTNIAEPHELRAPINQLAHARSFPAPSFTDVVRPNADTLYTALTFDVSKEPLIVSVPSSNDRYFLLPWLDWWTDVFTAPGSRTTGNAAQTFAIVAPNWQGKLPEGIIEYRSPTAYGLLIGRTQTNGQSDYEAVYKFQDGIRVYPLSAYGKEYHPEKGKVNPDMDMSPPPDQVDKMDAKTFFTIFANQLKINPPHANDYPILDRLKHIGIEPGNDFSFDQAPKYIQDALNAAPAQALKQIKESFANSGTSVNGWRTNFTAIGTYGTDYLRRAGVAYAGLGANVPEDAIYPTAYVDADGNAFDSSQRYMLHFPKDKIPPVHGFWSLTMYNQRQLFAPNPLERYAIGDRDLLVYNSDGSLDLYIQRESPGKDKEANWLPTPASGPFTMNLRFYWPKTEVLNGSWSPPPVAKVSNSKQG